MPYFKLFQRHVEAVHAIKTLLSRDLDEATDSDIDMDFLSSEQLTALKEELDVADKELKVIYETWKTMEAAKKANGGVVSDGGS